MCEKTVLPYKAKDLDSPNPEVRKAALLALLEEKNPHKVVWLRLALGYVYVGKTAKILCTGNKLRMSVSEQIEVQMYSIDSEGLKEGWRKVNDHVGNNIVYEFEGCHKQPADPDHPNSLVFRSRSGDIIILSSEQLEVDQANAIFES